MDARNVTHFAQVDFRNDRRVFGVKDEDRFSHIYIIGKTGTGKSTLLETMALQDVERGNGRRYLKIPRNSPMAPSEAMKVNEMTIKSAKELVTEATAAVETLPAKTAVQLLGRPDIVFVDLREKEELEKSGRLKGAVAVPRGLLEFQADPKSSAHLTALDPSKHLVLFCGSGGRSALAARTLKE
jgi:rhodanese-related sulfurtransferase